MVTEYQGVPAGAAAVIPRLFCRDVDAEIDFCRNAFGAVESIRRPGPDSRRHAGRRDFGGRAARALVDARDGFYSPPAPLN